MTRPFPWSKPVVLPLQGIGVAEHDVLRLP